MAKLDPELETEAEFVGGESDDPDKITDAEALGARHRRRFGYTSEGAQEHDMDIAAKGRKPMGIQHHRSEVPQSRIANFHHAVTAHRGITTIKKH